MRAIYTASPPRPPKSQHWTTRKQSITLVNKQRPPLVGVLKRNRSLSGTGHRGPLLYVNKYFWGLSPIASVKLCCILDPCTWSPLLQYWSNMVKVFGPISLCFYGNIPYVLHWRPLTSPTCGPYILDSLCWDVSTHIITGYSPCMCAGKCFSHSKAGCLVTACIAVGHSSPVSSVFGSHLLVILCCADLETVSQVQ